jgi:hypothetical protein
MPRKRPSSHSDKQFALFLERASGMLQEEQHDRFESIVRSLLLNRAAPADAGASDAQEPRDTESLLADGAPDTVVASNLLSLIGRLAFSWSNNENLLTYLMKLLLETDEASTKIIFSTLNTTRARVYLVRRLAEVKVNEPQIKARLQNLTERIEQANRLKNEFMQATFSVNDDGKAASMSMSEVEPGSDRLRFDKDRLVDPARIEAVAEACRDLRRLNRDLWAFLPRLRDAVISPEEG